MRKSQTPPAVTRVALVDDHNLVRLGFSRLIDEIEGYRVVLDAANGKEFMQAVEREPVDIAIIDLQMPVMDGHQTVEWIHSNCPQTRSLVLTFDATEDSLTRAIRLGARGYILKTIDLAEFKIALDTIRDKGYYHSELVDHPDGLTSYERERLAVLARITPRQLDFLQLIGDERELTYPQMADIMGVHPRSIDNYFQGLRDEFHIRSKTGMLLFAVKWGIVKV